MPSFLIGNYEIEGEQEVEELLDALRETDERLQSTACWRLMRSVAEKSVESSEFSLQRISPGQLSVMVIAAAFCVMKGESVAEETGSEDFDAASRSEIDKRYEELMFSPQSFLEEFERLFLESFADDNPDTIDTGSIAILLRHFYFSLPENQED